MVIQLKKDNDMGKLRTSEELKQLFQQNKERRERQIQKEKERKKKEQDKLQQLKKLQAPILKEIQRLRAIKKQQDEQQQALTKKCPYNASEWSKISRMKVYNNHLMDREPGERELYLTREELMDAEDRGEGKINWSKWDELITKTKNKIYEQINTTKDKDD